MYVCNPCNFSCQPIPFHSWGRTNLSFSWLQKINSIENAVCIDLCTSLAELNTTRGPWRDRYTTRETSPVLPQRDGYTTRRASPVMPRRLNTTHHLSTQGDTTRHLLTQGDTMHHILTRGNTTRHLSMQGDTMRHLLMWGNTTRHLSTRGDDTTRHLLTWGKEVTIII